MPRRGDGTGGCRRNHPAGGPGGRVMERDVTVTSVHGTSTVRTGLSLDQAYRILKAVRQGNFEDSLCCSYEQYGAQITQTKAKWLLFKAQSLLDKDKQEAAAPARLVVGDFGRIMSLFEQAQAHLKFPKIRLQTRDGSPVVLALAGPNSKYRGQVVVTTGEPYGTPGSWFGTIDQRGTTNVRSEAVVEVLQAFAVDPVKVAAEYGKATGNCCFCRLPLTNGAAGSASVGYGPICAKNYDLPWEPNGGDWAFTAGNPVVTPWEEDPEVALQRQDDADWTAKQARPEGEALQVREPAERDHWDQLNEAFDRLEATESDGPAVEPVSAGSREVVEFAAFLLGLVLFSQAGLI